VAQLDAQSPVPQQVQKVGRATAGTTVALANCPNWHGPAVAAASSWSTRPNRSVSGRRCADNASSVARMCGFQPVTTTYRQPSANATSAEAAKATRSSCTIRVAGRTSISHRPVLV